MSEEIVKRDFSARDLDEQQDLLQQTWCNHCQEVDLGMCNAEEFATKDRVWIEGDCNKCGNKTVTELIEEDE